MEAVFLTSGGAEANESAFKTARFYWKARGKPDKVKIIARDQAYHGLTLQTMSATGMGRGYWKMFEPRVPGFVHIPTCYPYRYQAAAPDQTGPGVGQARRSLDARVHQLGPPDLLRGRAEEHRDSASRAALCARGGDGRSAPRRSQGGVR